MDRIPYLNPDEDRKVSRRSSLDQYRHTFCVMERGGWTPICFDALEYIDCDRVVSHPAILTDDPNWIGYHYPIEELPMVEESYVYHDHYGTEVHPLPEEVGSGFYEKVVDAKAFTNADNGALGVRNEKKLKVGLDYYLADHTLRGE